MGIDRTISHLVSRVDAGPIFRGVLKEVATVYRAHALRLLQERLQERSRLCTAMTTGHLRCQSMQRGFC